MTGDRYTRKDAERAFVRLCGMTGHRPARAWNDVGGWLFDWNGTYGGGVVAEVVTDGGGQSHPLGDRRRTAREFCDAVYFAARVLDAVESDTADGTRDIGPVARYLTRDIGYGVEEGDVVLPALDGPDWTGKRPYRTPFGAIVFLFDDEVES